VNLTTRIAWRQRALEALASSSPNARERAELLEGAAAAIRAEVSAHDKGVSARAAAGLGEALAALAELERWEQDVLAAAVDAERHRRAAVLRAQQAGRALSGADGSLVPVRSALERIAAVADLDERAAIRDQLRRLALPLALINSPAASAQGVVPRVDAGVVDAPNPRVVLLPSIDGSPITAAHVLTPNQVHDLQVEVRVLDWPADSEQLILRLLSRWPASAVEVTEISIARPAKEIEGVRTGRGSSHLVLHAAAADPLTPINFNIEGQFIGQDTRTARLLGHRELSVRTFDQEKDVITGAPVLDERILAMLAELRDEGIAPDEQPAFGRFLAAVARAGMRIMAEREFPEGSNPKESEFQREMLKRLAMATELEGRISEHAWQGGGETDLAHDGVIAELKVEKLKAVTLEGSTKYLAQTTHYASAGQRQLSIMVILDMTAKETPPGVLANSIGWLIPKLHGLDDPAYPSRVAAVILNGNLPLPSDWSR
jgi:hypothetical protein